MNMLRAGLIGQNISRTRLPAALQIMCDAAGWTLDFELIDTAAMVAFDFTSTVNRCRKNGWTGVSVTHPWKSAARAYAGKGMNPDLAHLGAANMLVFSSLLHGDNTDYTGFLAAYRDRALPRPGRVVLVGAGGVAEALAPALVQLGADDLAIVDLDIARSQSLAGRVGGPAYALNPEDVADAVRSANGLLNATPLGMVEHPGLPIDAAWIGGQSWAFDAVYTPTNTAFLRTAGAAGLTCLTGFDLFRAMAIRTFGAYTGLEVDRALILPLLDQLRPDAV